MKLVKNSFYSLGTHIWSILLSLISTPFIVGGMGVEVFGIYAITLTLTGYLSLFDLGLSNAVVRAISEAYAQNDLLKMRKIISTALTSYIVIGCLLGGILALGTQLLTYDLLNIPAKLKEIAQTSIYLASINLALNMVFVVIPATITALQRFDLFFWRNFFYSNINNVGTLIIVWLGYDLRIVMFYGLVLAILNSLVWIKLYNKLLPQVKLVPGFDFGTFKSLLGYGLFKLLSTIASYTAAYTDRVIIGLFLPISAVTFYTVPSTVAQKMSGLQAAFIPVFPAMVEKWSRGQLVGFNELYLKSTRYLTFVIMPVAAGLMIFGEQFLFYWVGPQFAFESTTVLRLLVLAYLLNTLASTAGIVIDVIGKPGIYTAFYTISCIVNFGLLLVLVPILGINGAALAYTLTALGHNFLFIFFINLKYINLNLSQIFTEGFGRPILATFCAGTIPFILLMIVKSNFFLILMAGLLYLLLYLVFSILLKVVDKDEISKFKQSLIVR